jgi:hypothetical protein
VEAERLARALSAAQKKRAQLTVEQWIEQHPGSENDEEEKR